MSGRCGVVGAWGGVVFGRCGVVVLVKRRRGPRLPGALVSGSRQDGVNAASGRVVPLAPVLPWGMTDRSRRSTLRTTAVTVPFAVAGPLALLREVVGRAPAVLVLVLVVVAVSSAGDRVAGVLTALTAAVGFDLFLTAPYRSLAISDPQDVELALALMVVGLAVGELALRGLRAQDTSARREGYLDGLSALLDLPEDSSVDDRGEALAHAVSRVVRVDSVRWRPSPPDGRDALVGEHGELEIDGHVVDPARQGLPTDRVTALPVRVGSQIVGHLALTAASRVARPSAEQLRVAALLARIGGPRTSRK